MDILPLLSFKSKYLATSDVVRDVGHHELLTTNTTYTGREKDWDPYVSIGTSEFCQRRGERCGGERATDQRNVSSRLKKYLETKLGMVLDTSSTPDIIVEENGYLCDVELSPTTNSD